jgi:hypothetical protein
MMTWAEPSMSLCTAPGARWVSKICQHSFRKRYSDLGLESGQELDALEAPQSQVAVEQGVRPQTGESPLGAQLVEKAGERFENATLRSSAVQLLSWLHSFIRSASRQTLFPYPDVRRQGVQTIRVARPDSTSPRE